MSKIRTKFTPEVRELSTPVEFCPHPLVGHFYIGGALLHKPESVLSSARTRSASPSV